MIEVRSPLPEEMPAAFDLRWRVLREPLGEPRGSEQDEFETVASTIHGAAFEDGHLIGTGRIHVASEDPRELQVRYMATDELYRGRGIGAKVLSLMEDMAHDLSPSTGAIILDARSGAVSLYEKGGYRKVSGEVLLHGIPHYKMRKDFVS